MLYALRRAWRWLSGLRITHKDQLSTLSALQGYAEQEHIKYAYKNKVLAHDVQDLILQVKELKKAALKKGKQ